MSRFTQLVLIALFLAYLSPAQAMVKIDTGINACQIFAAEDSDGGKNKDKKDKDKKDGGKEEEAEPDCD